MPPQNREPAGAAKPSVTDQAQSIGEAKAAPPKGEAAPNSVKDLDERILSEARRLAEAVMDGILRIPVPWSESQKQMLRGEAPPNDPFLVPSMEGSPKALQTPTESKPAPEVARGEAKKGIPAPEQDYSAALDGISRIPVPWPEEQQQKLRGGTPLSGPFPVPSMEDPPVVAPAPFNPGAAKGKGQVR